MTPQETLQEYVIVAEGRLQKLQELARSMQEYLNALVALDRIAIQRNTAHLEDLSSQIRQLSDTLAELNSQLANVLCNSSDDVATAFYRRRQTANRSMKDVLLKIQQRARVHDALLRHSARSLQIMMNVLTSHASTYRFDPQFVNTNLNAMLEERS